MKKYFFLALIAFFMAINPATAAKHAKEFKYIITLKTNYGDIEISLLNTTKKHRDNFIKNVKGKIYNGVKFHRIIREFMIQTGDYNTKIENYPIDKYGSSSYGQNVEPEFTSGAIHTMGAVAMARESDNVNPKKLSSGSQFYIITGGNKVTNAMLDRQEKIIGKKYTEMQRTNYLTNGGAPHLDHEYVVFGGVTEGISVVKSISKIETDKYGVPIIPVTILKAKVKKVK